MRTSQTTWTLRCLSSLLPPLDWKKDRSCDVKYTCFWLVVNSAFAPAIRLINWAVPRGLVLGSWRRNGLKVQQAGYEALFWGWQGCDCIGDRAPERPRCIELPGDDLFEGTQLLLWLRLDIGCQP
jgi:hypothetical protein